MAGANTVRGELDVEIGGQKFVLVPSFQRIARLEVQLGQSLVALANNLAQTQSITFSDIVIIIDTMARAPKPDTQEIGELIVRHGMSSAMPALQTFLERVLLGGGDSEGNSGSEDASSDD